MGKGKIAKTEWLLLGMTAAFLCGLLIASRYDRTTAQEIETRYEVPQEEVLPDLSPLNLNTATAEELAQLPGIGETLAGRIVAYRETQGGFSQIEDLMRVSGIGQGKFDAVRDRIAVEEAE